jgi:hypothetical protein
MKAYRIYHKRIPEEIGIAWGKSASKARWIAARSYMDAGYGDAKEAITGMVVRRVSLYDCLYPRRYTGEKFLRESYVVGLINGREEVNVS